jgi:hypothetical protein
MKVNGERDVDNYEERKQKKERKERKKNSPMNFNRRHIQDRLNELYNQNAHHAVIGFEVLEVKQSDDIVIKIKKIKPASLMKIMVIANQFWPLTDIPNIMVDLSNQVYSMIFGDSSKSIKISGQTCYDLSWRVSKKGYKYEDLDIIWKIFVEAEADYERLFESTTEATSSISPSIHQRTYADVLKSGTEDETVKESCTSHPSSTKISEAPNKGTKHKTPSSIPTSKPLKVQRVEPKPTRHGNRSNILESNVHCILNTDQVVIKDFISSHVISRGKYLWKHMQECMWNI